MWHRGKAQREQYEYQRSNRCPTAVLPHTLVPSRQERRGSFTLVKRGWGASGLIGH